MIRKWLVGSTLGLIGLMGGGYTIALKAAMPEALLRQPFTCIGWQRPIADHFQVLTVRRWAKGVVVLSQGTCAADKTTAGAAQNSQATPKKSDPILNYRIVQQQDWQWVSSATGHHRLRDTPTEKTQLVQQSSSRQMIDYHIDRFMVSPSGSKLAQTSAHPKSWAIPRQERYTIFYGKVISKDVGAVEVTFNNGEVLRDRSPDGYISLISEGATGICDIRILGFDQQILLREEYAIAVGLTAQDAGRVCRTIARPV
jgi:hypothetical protein